MQLRIWHKLFLSFLAATALVVVVTLLLTRYSFNRGFIDYMNQLQSERLTTLSAELATHYVEFGSLEAFGDDSGLWRDVLRTAFAGSRRRGGQRPRNDRRDGPPRNGPHGGNTPPPAELPRQSLRVDLLDSNGELIRGRDPARDSSQRFAIDHRGQVIGYLRYLPVSSITDVSARADQQFVHGQRRNLWSVALVALTVAAALAMLMARQLVAPVRALNRGANNIAKGNLTERIRVQSNDELGQLATDFNAMAESLEQMQAARRQWIVDISHELRTPLAILGGELHALEDGVREWDDSSRSSLQAEVERLSRLVSDLHELSLSDSGGMSYTMERLNLVDVVHHALETCQTRLAEPSLEVTTDLPDEPLMIQGDAQRLTQMLINLLENSARYTDVGGRVHVAARRDAAVYLTVEDSAPGVSDAALPHLFERLYRVEESRNRSTGGSGLGLAICQAVVTAHGGQIRASASPLGGLRIEVEFRHDH